MAPSQKLGWLAGLLDGEGCVTCRITKRGRVEPYVSLEMCDEVTVGTAAEVIRSVGAELSAHACRRREPVSSDSWQLRVNRTESLWRLARTVGPDSVTKASQWALMEELCTIRLQNAAPTGRIRRGMHALPVSQDELDLAQALITLNRRRSR